MSPWVRRALAQAQEAGRRPVQTAPNITLGDPVKADEVAASTRTVAACRHGMRQSGCRKEVTK